MMISAQSEWLETDGLGGFASGTLSGRRSRRYHALLLTATHPPLGRFVLVNGFEAMVSTGEGQFAISSQHYMPNVVHPNGDQHRRSFTLEPWPTWLYVLPDGTQIQQEVFIPHGFSAVVLRWTLVNPKPGLKTLSVRPLLSGRDYHALHYQNAGFRFDHEGDGSQLRWHPYNGVPAIRAMTNGSYTSEPLWFNQFRYRQEEERGLDFVEDLAAPGVFRFELGQAPAVCVLTAEGPNQLELSEPLNDAVEQLSSRERQRRSSFKSPLHRAANQFLVQRGTGKTLIAGYPWFTDWGRDTFIALRGLCLATGDLKTAGEILSAWAGTVSDGMVPNRFVDAGQEPEFNSVDASLWFVIVAGEYLEARERAGSPVEGDELTNLKQAISSILTGYQTGTRFGIQVDPTDGLVRAGVEGVQLTWMDAKVDDWVVTPRIGKPVEIQALWANALKIGAKFDSKWPKSLDLVLQNFSRKFWNEQAGCLYDVIDVNHEDGVHDPSIRPNQIFAAGGLPVSLLNDKQAKLVVELVDQTLMTEMGLRTLSPTDTRYHVYYLGGIRERDGAYHQGTVWPWLTGAFIQAWLRAKGNTAENRAAARQRFLEPLQRHLSTAGLGHLSEIFDAEQTIKSTETRQIPRGCPFQAWSLGEYLRMQTLLS